MIAFSIEMNPEDANLSLSEITTPNLSVSVPPVLSVDSSLRSDDDYEVLLENEGQKILKRVDLAK